MLRRKTKILPWIIGLCIVVAIIGANHNQESTESEQSNQQASDLVSDYSEENDNSDDKNTESVSTNSVKTDHSAEPKNPAETYQVVSVVDGDTFKINYQGRVTSVRLIGVNTPETVDPRKSVECFGVEASNFLKNQLDGKTVTLVADPTQPDRDKYNRLLRYVYLDGEDVGLKIISSGYGYEYTYNIPYQKQSEYKTAQATASSNARGLWAPNTCSNSTPVANNNAPANNAKTCNIKGNINSKGEKIYHLPGQRFYDKTQIDTSKGERWFCSEDEARNAGWRAAKV